MMKICLTFFTISDIVSKTFEFSCTLFPTEMTRSRSSSTSVSCVTIPKRTQIRPSVPSPSEKALSVDRRVSTRSVLSLFNSVFAWSVSNVSQPSGTNRTPPMPAQSGSGTNLSTSLFSTSLLNVALCLTVARSMSTCASKQCAKFSKLSGVGGCSPRPSSRGQNRMHVPWIWWSIISKSNWNDNHVWMRIDQE